MARILVIAYTTYIRDARVKRHAEALARRGDVVDVICLDSGQGETTINDVNLIGIRLPRYRGASRTRYLRSYARFFTIAAWTALRMGLKKRYDLAIVCTMPDAAVLSALPIRCLGTKVVLDVHDTMPELYRDKFGGRRGTLGARLLMAGERASAACADRVFAVHDPHRDRLIDAGVAARKIGVVMNAPDPEIFRPLGTGRRRKDGFTVACHGTLTRRLGLDIAIEAVRLARPRVPGLRFLVLGGGDYLEEARRLTTRLNLDDCVTFMPPVPVERLPAMLLGVDVGLVPNRASSATHLMLPVKLLDYVAMGIPTIAARLQTIEHYFHDEAVRFFEPDDSVDLAAAIEELYHDPDGRARLAVNARKIIRTIGWHTQADEYYRLIDSLIGDSQPDMDSSPIAAGKGRT